ncbi:hypothetical protein CLV88_12537 [Shimia abyssi]|uniref:Uncharacterized protein n=1 Tax=Shimia abyssi TaxID=1662395 RepID=A0A2P8F0Z7_9RHOB|nr:hypothetical protein CLV88_12537 [Shimia abyssi]
MKEVCMRVWRTSSADLGLPCVEHHMPAARYLPKEPASLGILAPRNTGRDHRSPFYSGEYIRLN